MNNWPLADLDVIAYASALETPVRPRVLPPVFRVRADPSVILLPPFNVVANQLFNPIVSCPEDLADFVLREDVTELETPIPAEAHHDLWVNAEGQLIYEAKHEVKRAFESLFTTHLDLARQSLKAKDYDAATRHAEVARSAKPAHLDPLVLLGAVEYVTHGRDSSQFAFITHLAKSQIDGAEFENLARECAGGRRGALVMKDIATIANSSKYALAA